MATVSVTLNLDLLLRLRLVIARMGEMDGAGWWNTRGVLGATGAFVYRRTFPPTYLLHRPRRFRRGAQPLPGNFRTTPLRHPLEPAGRNRGPVRGSMAEWLDQVETWQPFFAGLDASVGGK